MKERAKRQRATAFGRAEARRYTCRPKIWWAGYNAAMISGRAKEFRHKNIRLGRSNYIGRRWYFVTVCCHERRPLFTSTARAQWLLRHLKQASLQFSFAIHAYCMMPDHLHFLAEGNAESSDLTRFVGALKQKTGQLFQTRTGRPLWQKKYYDHILRRNADVDAIAWYIWMNPVRKRLSATPQKFPYSGSFTRTLEMLQPKDATWQPPWKKHM